MAPAAAIPYADARRHEHVQQLQQQHMTHSTARAATDCFFAGHLDMPLFTAAALD